jgi:2-(1,2-epoxy-1,2-dihydrophenyl)acetyl-CoA isomerase
MNMTNSSSYQHIQFSISNGLARLTFDRPNKLNCFNEPMHEEIRQALKLLKKDNCVSCLLVTGNGRGFCAGQDLSERNIDPDAEMPDLGESLERNYNPMLRTLKTFPFPVVCAVNGVAAGSGANIALACDIVLAARSAFFIQPFVKLGLIPDAGGSWSLPRLIGRARATAISMLGDQVSAEQAEQWGMIYRCVDDGQLQDEANKIALQLASSSSYGLMLIKRALDASHLNNFDQQLDLERDLQRLAGRSDEYRQAVKSFIEKRSQNS